MKRARSLACCVVAALLAGCAPGPEPEIVAIPDYKADDFWSPVGAEFDVESAPLSVKLDEQALELDEQARQAHIEELVRAKVDRVSRALDAKLWEIFPKADRKSKSGVVVMLREAATDFDALEQIGADSYAFVFRGEVAATDKLLEELPLVARDGERVLALELGSGEESEEVLLRFSPSATVTNAYPDFKRLLEDGLSIYLHFGGEHHDTRYDLRKARQTFEALVARGFKAPVESFDALELDSGPFTGELDVNGAEVAVTVTLVHSDMAADDELDKLTNSYKTGAKNADVVVYAGHASTDTNYSGVVVHYGPRVAIPGSAFKDLELPKRYQIFAFAGCETYTGYADRLYENPSKTTANLDVITAVNLSPSSANFVTAFLDALLGAAGATWVPQTWDGVLRRVNAEAGRHWTTVYGVHGLSDNPKISPLADPAAIGRPCKSSDECPGADSLCVVSWVTSERSCGAACTDSSGCPDHARCWWSFSSLLSAPARQCVAIR